MRTAIWTRPEIPFADLPDDSGAQLLTNLISSNIIRLIATIELKPIYIEKNKEIYSNFCKNYQKQIWLLTSPAAVFFFHQIMKTGIMDNHLSIIPVFIGQQTQAYFTQYFSTYKKFPFVQPTGKEEAKFLASSLIQWREQGILPQYPVLHPTGNKTDVNYWQKQIYNAHFPIYQPLICYQNETAWENKQKIAAFVNRSVDWFFFSPSAVDALMNILNLSAVQSDWTAWCIGIKTAACAEKWRFPDIKISPTASQAELLNLYKKYYSLS